uniref:Uncharacterized protein n=1 Tax=Rhizophora mucronata TaxID=61149 RepID=A0A2P2JJJ0_RHIMU
MCLNNRSLSKVDEVIAPFGLPLYVLHEAQNLIHNPFSLCAKIPKSIACLKIQQHTWCQCMMSVKMVDVLSSLRSVPLHISQ